jgi:predicted chitinase
MLIKFNQKSYLKRWTCQSSELSDADKVEVDETVSLETVDEAKDSVHLKFRVKEPSLPGWWYAYIPHTVSPESEKRKEEPAASTILDTAIIIDKKTLDAVFDEISYDWEWKDLNRCLTTFGITSKENIRQFLAQCAHESGAFQYNKELAPGDAYEFRSDLGNTEPGDGRRFKGCGWLQVTGRYNYQRFSDFIKDPRVMEGVDYCAPRYPATMAGFWWHDNDMVHKIDNQGYTIEDTSRAVNGGWNGLEDRIYYYNRAKAYIF